MAPANYIVSDSASIAWQSDAALPGVAIKPLGSAGGQTMELHRYAPNTAFPEHVHKGAEFVYVIEGSARLAGRWLGPGWSSVGAAGSVDADFLSGPEGCVFLAIYTP